MEELNVVSTENVIEERQPSFLRRVHRMNQEKLAKEMFEVRVSEKNKVGTPQKRWIEQVRKTSEQRDINWREVGTLPQNREAWKRKIGHNDK